MAESASDWGFLKVLLSLNTGLIGLLIYGYEHFSNLPYGRVFVPLCLGILSSSFLLTIRAAWCLVTVDATIERNPDTPIGELSDGGQFIKHVAGHQTAIHRAIILFTAGVVLSVVYFACAFAMPPVPTKAGPVMYFTKKIECRKYEDELQKELARNSDLATQSVERIFYSPPLDSCVAVVYSLYSGPQAKTVVYMEDVLTEKLLWQAEYPDKGADHKSYEGVMADVDHKIRDMELEKGN
jgi:hypothetical protein